jgi:hypothetical protein
MVRGPGTQLVGFHVLLGVRSPYPPPPSPPPPSPTHAHAHAPVLSARAAPYEPPLGQISIRYFKNKACQTAYTRYMCYLNFPRCDSSGASLLMCRSACENFFKACNFPSPQVETGTSLWRCGPAKYLGGEGVEAMFAVTGDGLPVYQRAWWPGLPFADNEPGGCTPGVPGGAAASAPSAAALALAAAVALLALARAA